MQDALVVSGGKPGAELSGNLQRLLLGGSSHASQHRSQVFAVDVLHGNEMLPAFLGDVVDATYVRVRDLPSDPDFMEESFELASVVRQGLGEKLECHGLTQLEVVGAVDFAHPALADQTHDSVTIREHSPRRKSGVVDRVRGGRTKRSLTTERGSLHRARADGRRDDLRGHGIRAIGTDASVPGNLTGADWAKLQRRSSKMQTTTGSLPSSASHLNSVDDPRPSEVCPSYPSGVPCSRRSHVQRRQRCRRSSAALPLLPSRVRERTQAWEQRYATANLDAASAGSFEEFRARPACPCCPTLGILGSMLIRFKRTINGVVLSCLRGGKSAAVQRTGHGGFFALHDLMHYAVETVLGFDEAFFGLLAAGWSFENFTRRDDPQYRPLPPQAVIAEFAVGILTQHNRERAIDDPDVLALLTEEINRDLAAAMRSAAVTPPKLTTFQVSEIYRVFESLVRRWACVEAGDHLELNFGCGSSQSDDRTACGARSATGGEGGA